MSEIAEHWIGGEWVGSGIVKESVNPATGAVLGRWADGGEDEARAAIGAARRAFETSPWSRDRSLRNRALSEMADRFDAHADELGALVTKENGKILAQGMFESGTAGGTLRHNAAQALTDTGISAEVAPGQWFSTYAEPAGVVGIIVPWNGPVALFIRSLGPALAAGNTVAVKMPGQTALVANLMSQIIAEVTSLPRAVVNIFTESGNTGAPCLVASPDAQVISYTGSIAVGRIVAATGAPTLKRMNLELGGKTPMSVFDDADLDTAVPLLAAAVTTFTGQFCMTGSRILVQRGVADEVRTRLARSLENVRLGDGLDPGTAAALAGRAGRDLPRAPRTGRRDVGFRTRDGDPRAAHRVRRGVRPAPGGAADPRPSRRDAPLLRLAHPACLRVQPLLAAHPQAPAGLPVGQHLGNHQRELQRPGAHHHLARGRRRPHHVCQRLPLRDGHRRGPWIETAPISENDRRKICYGNAATLFGLPR